MANDIRKYPVPLIFKKSLKDNITGTLIVSNANENWEKKIFIINSRVAFATSTMDQEKIGEILLAEGKIERDQLEMAVEVRKNVPTKIGEILAKLCDLSMRDIFMALNSQTLKIAASTFSLAEGEWRFIMGNPEIPNPNSLNIKIPDIIREGVKQINNISYFKRRFYYRAPVAIELTGDIEHILTHQEKLFYEELTRHTNTSVKKIFELLKIPEIKFWRKIILLYLLNVNDFVEFTVDNENQNQKLEEINELYRKINEKKVDHNQLLGINQSSSPAEIKKQFDAFSKKFAPEELKIAPDSTSKFRVDKVQAEIRKAYEAAQLEAAKRGAAKAAASTPQPNQATQPPAQQPDQSPAKNAIETEENKIQAARDYFVKGNTLYNNKRYREAAALLQKAVDRDDSKANYFLLLGLCQSKMAATKKNAERNLKKAAAMEPWNADPLFALGQLYKSENLMHKAKTCYEQALEINMEHTLAGQAMDQMGDLFGKGNKKSILSLFGKKK